MMPCSLPHRLLVDDVRQRLGYILARERPLACLAGQHFGQHRAERPDLRGREHRHHHIVERDSLDLQIGTLVRIAESRQEDGVVHTVRFERRQDARGEVEVHVPTISPAWGARREQSPCPLRRREAPQLFLPVEDDANLGLRGDSDLPR